MGKLPSEEEIMGYFSSLSNWGRWGKEDQLGTLNFITDKKRVEAAKLVRDGITVSTARILDPDNPDSLGRGSILQRFMVWTGDSGIPTNHLQLDEPTQEKVRLRAAREYVGMVAHGSQTHVDALSHVMWDGKMYNGFPASAVTTQFGATKLSIHELEAGIVSRGVLLDIAALRGVDYLGVGEGVYPEELEEAEKRQGVTVQEGDVLLLRTGNFKRVEAEGIHPKQGQSGYSAACLPWLHERGVAMISCDSINDVQPSGYSKAELLAPIHAVGISAMGLWLVDNMALDDLGETCARLNRWEFMFSMSVLRVVGATSSPVNPVALF